MRRLKPLLLLALLGAIAVAVKQRLGAATAPAPVGSTDPFMAASTRVVPTEAGQSPSSASAASTSVRPADAGPVDEDVADTGAAPADTEAAPADTGAAPADTGAAPADTGAATDEVTAEVPLASAPLAAASEDGSVDGGVDGVAAAAGLSLPTPPHGPFATAPDGPPDDLKRISGVGPKLEQMLNAEGITTFAQLASMTDEQVDKLQERLPQFPGRIRRDDWVAQAQRLRDA